MIKIKLTNWNKGRNNHTFRPFLMYGNRFSEIGIQFVEGGSYDYEFIGMMDFLDKGIPLKDSIQMGIENMLKHYIPEVLAVEGIEDPNSTVSPYYQ